MKYILWTVLIFFITLVNTQTLIAKPPVYVDSLQDGLALAESTKKDLLVVFGARWCVHCGSLKRDISNNESIANNMIVCYIDIDVNRDLVKEYRVSKVPDYFILRESVEIKRQVGYEGFQKLKQWLRDRRK